MKLFIWLLYNSQHLIIFYLYISFWDRCLKFLIFQFDEQVFGFWSSYFFHKNRFSFFPSQILICATVFAAHYLFLFWDLHWLSSLSKNIKSVGRYIGTSLCMYQNHQDYWPIIHDKLEDQFSTVTHRFQDFSHKDRCAYKTS